MRMVNQAAIVLLALSLLVADARSDERELSAVPSQPATRPERAPIARLREVDLGDFWRGEKPAFGDSYNMLQRQAGYLGSGELAVTVRDKCVRRAGVIVFNSKPEAAAAVEYWRKNVANVIEPGTQTDQRRDPWWFCAKSGQPLLIVVYDGMVVWASDIVFGTPYEKVEGELWRAVEKIHSSVVPDGVQAPPATRPATQAPASLPATGRDSRLAHVKLAVGMKRMEAERLIAQATGVESKYNLYAMDMTSSEVRYSGGTVILIVRYKPGSPGPTIQLPDGNRQGYPPEDGEVLSWEFAAGERELSVELVFRKNPPAIAAGESIVVEARFVNRTDKPQVYRGGLGDRNIKASCQVTLTDGGGKGWSARAAAAPMANYKDITVPAGGQTAIGEWDLSTLVYSEGSPWRAGGKVPFADIARPGRYRVSWWDGVFQAGTPLRSKPVEFEIAPAAAPATRPGAFDLDAAANLLSKEVGGKWEKDKHNALPPERSVLRGRFDSEPGIAAALYIVFPFGSNDKDMQQLFVKAYANAEGVRWLGANDQCTVLEARAKGEAARVWSERIATTLKLQPLPMVPGAPAAAEPAAASRPATRPEIHGYMDRIRPLLPKGWSARVLADYALCIEHEQSPTRIMLRIGERIGGQEEYRRLLAEHEDFLKQWNTRFPYGTSMPPNAPAVVLRPPTHFDDRHSVWLLRFPTGPGAEKGVVETKELAAESNGIYNSVARLFTPYDFSPSATQPREFKFEIHGGYAPTTSPATPPSGDAGDGEGLRLRAVLAAGAPVEFLPGQAIPFEVQLINASRTREYTVVKPGDGSESGWREPHVYYAAERFAPEGQWTPLAPASTHRCGLFDSQWQKDVVTLKPGESLALKEWLLPPSSVFEFQQAGRYRIRVHYSYRGGQAHKGAASRPAEDLGGMKGVEPFEVVSAPVEMAVQRPLNVTLKVRGNLIANQPARLSDLLEIAVSNDSDKPISAGQPTLSAEGRLTLQMIAPLGWGPTLDKQNNPHAARMDLQPGRSVSLLGAGEFANGLDGSWTYPRAGTVKLRAGYTPSTWKDIGTVWSDWADVKVEPAKTPSPSPSPALQNRGL